MVRNSFVCYVMLLLAIFAHPSMSQVSAGGKAQKRKTQYPFRFKDVGKETGLLPAVGGIRGHGAAWGDVDGDGWPELFVASFHNAGSKPGMFFQNENGKFKLDGQKHLRTSGMGSGALFLDLTNNGRLDLYVSNCAIKNRDPVRQIPSYLFQNKGKGKFVDVTKKSGTTLPLFAGRGIAALDYDGDGLLDFVCCERYYGKVKHGPTLFRNLGNYQFTNVSKGVGLPPKLSGLSVAVADVNNDTWPDIFFTEGKGEHRLYLNDGKGKFKEAPGTREIFRWKGLGREDAPAGVCIADVDRNGLPDIVIGQHFESPWTDPVPPKLYLNTGVKNGIPQYKDATKSAGITPLKMRGAHVEIQDFDNDGWPDIYVSVVVFKDGKPHPVIYENLGVRDGFLRFRESAFGLTDFPTAKDKAVRRSGPFFDKLLKEKKVIYMAAAPSADFNRDGKLDLFLAHWWISQPSLLLRNETPAGNWLDVQIVGKKGINRMGIGSQVRLYPAGKLGKKSALLGAREIAIGYGYCSGQEAISHFGLGKHTAVDVEVILPHDKGKLVRKNVKANQRITISNGR